ncbi:hypothetical protein M079_3549 [Bacteroides fragilis str. 3996 N(B) 6]|uniref:Uncharacterized protein n=3 Tax=Bacteroides fragilis TaxID=817 RepID=A0A015VTS6_BACFG|nr:hypothetical protein M079_3549 [Bacteroides fragilis str. 3996 N(B) 6]EXY89393.1 hypothetical protein M125_3941 [Bacteroides fragilis str. 3998T(B)3]EXY94317.1 hypothetical protein M081_3545 [Bacteroides fragilis str. 3998 T(B) 4]EXZ04343.1 hypothetical protein M072_3264 [Bacteroides fragilis str. DS-208]EXZ32527.1 hypothetical protein M147_3563 [Bacteroides fragilis str. 1007-1-F \
MTNGKTTAFSGAIAKKPGKKRIQPVLKIQNDSSTCFCQNENFHLNRLSFLLSLLTHAFSASGVV